MATKKDKISNAVMLESAPVLSGGPPKAAPRPKARIKLDEQFKQLATLEVVNVATESINPNSYNPNRQSDRDFALLLMSMQEDGFTQPILVNRDDNVIVDGEHRWRAARELNMAEVPVVYVDFTDAQMRFSTLRHNRARGHEDLALTTALLKDLEALGALKQAQSSLGLSKEEIDRALNEAPIPEVLAGDSFSNAWIPRESSEEAIRHGEISDQRMSGASQGVIAKLEAITDLQKSATPEKKKLLEFDKGYVQWRLNLVFSGEEAAVVRTALGSDPAAKVLTFINRLTGYDPSKEAAITTQRLAASKEDILVKGGQGSMQTEEGTNG